MTSEKITMFDLLRSQSQWFLLLLGLLGVVNGLWGSALLLLINHKITGTDLPLFDKFDWLIYSLLTLASFITAYRFERYMLSITLNFGKKMSLKIFDDLRLATFESYEDLGEEKVRTVMNDVTTLESLPRVFLTSFNAAIMIIIGTCYLFWIFPPGATIMLLILIAIGSWFVYRNKAIEKDFQASRSLGDTYMRNVNDFLSGFKKIKMSTLRSNNIFNKYLSRNREKFIQLRERAFLNDLMNRLTGDYSFYTAIGFILFALPLIFQFDQKIQGNFLITLLFLMGPISTFVDLMGTYVSFKVAVRRINEFNEVIKDINYDSTLSGQFAMKESFQKIRFEDVSYAYLNGSTNFRLDTINFTINQGEVIFICGGNGSGKSTFINLLAGLYIPQSGKIYFNEHPITSENRPLYRNKLSCIFADDHLFSENYDDLNLQPTNSQFIEYLESMELYNVIKFDSDKNNVAHDISSGQRKRLLLIYSMMEEKDIFIFDEWAAEQDPSFRRYFYNTIIPDLQKKGKTVVAITHDDAYFKQADRLIKFDYGKMLELDDINTVIG